MALGPVSTKRKFGNSAMKSPSPNMMLDRLNIFLFNPDRFIPDSFLAPSAKGIATPSIKRKKGNTQSVGVHPCQSACKRALYELAQSPGLLTIIIQAMVMPRNTSKENNLFVKSIAKVYLCTLKKELKLINQLIHLVLQAR